MEGLTRLQEHRLELQHRLDMHRTMEMPPSPSPSSRSLAPFSSASSSLSEGSNQPSGEDSASIVTGIHTQVYFPRLLPLSVATRATRMRFYGSSRARNLHRSRDFARSSLRICVWDTARDPLMRHGEKGTERKRGREKKEKARNTIKCICIFGVTRTSNHHHQKWYAMPDRLTSAESVPRGAMTFLETMTKQHARYDYLCLDGCNIGDLDIPRHETLSTYLLVRTFQKSGYTVLALSWRFLLSVNKSSVA